MFAQPDWFGPGRRPGTVRPRSLPGWIHTAAWSGVLAAPGWLLASGGRIPEMFIWLGAMGLAWWHDLRPVRQAQRAARRDDLFVIDEQTDITRCAHNWLRGVLRRS